MIILPTIPVLAMFELTELESGFLGYRDSEKDFNEVF
jgi:hypothetical protein